MNRNNRPLSITGMIVALMAFSAAPVLAAAPSNDDIGSPIIIGTHPYTNSQDTSEATTGTTDADCAGMGHTVWYEYTPSSSLRLEANTFGSNYDTTLAVGTSDGAGGIDVIACNDDAGDGLQSRVRWDAAAGTSYLIQVGAFADSPGGSLTLNVEEAPPFTPVALDVTLNSTGQFNKDGSATIRGTVSCSGGDFVYMEASLAQRVGRFINRGYNETFLECDGADVPWQMTLSSNAGTFGGGKAQVSLFAAACNDEECVFADIDRTIRLKK